MSNEWAQKPMRPLDDRWRFARPGRVHKSSTLVTGQNRRRRRRVAALKTTLIFFLRFISLPVSLKGKNKQKSDDFLPSFSTSFALCYRFRSISVPGFFLFTAFSFIFVCLRNEFYRLDRERERERKERGRRPSAPV